MKQTILAVSAVVALAACSSGHKADAEPSNAVNSFSSALSSAPGSGSKTPDPVPILKKTGAEVPAGTATDRGSGQKQIAGLYYASAKDRASGSGERITVITYPSNAERAASGDVPNASDDAHWYITVDRALVTVTGVEDAASHSVVFALPAQTIATRIGGHLIPRG